MAGDWIKMRTSLTTDPKVAAIGESLLGERWFYDWLTGGQTDVTISDGALRHLVCGALHAVWSAANDHAENGVVAGAKLNWIDTISGIQGFGLAMSKVGWASDNPNGLLFPKFDANNTSGADRQKRYREKKRNAALRRRDVTGDVTPLSPLRPREEKRRVDKSREEELKHTHTPENLVFEITATEHIANWRLPKGMHGSEKCRHQLIEWQRVRKATHASFTQEASWDAESMIWQHWTEDEWFESLRFSTAKASKSLLDASTNFQEAAASNGKRKGAKDYSPITKEDIFGKDEK